MRRLLYILFLWSFVYGQQTVELCEGENSTYTYTSQGNVPGTYTWYINGSSAHVGNNFTYTWTTPGSYELACVLSSFASCVDSVTYNVDVVNCTETTLYIPDAFTPDGNNRNDTFEVKGTNIAELNMVIYNRWGQLLYQSSDIYKGWDGKVNGNLCQQDVYVYIVRWRDIKNRPFQKIGHITLIQ